MTVVLLDALGTLLALEEPGPHLARELGRRGIRVGVEQARAAMRAEIAFYRAEHHRAGTLPALAGLRRECAEVVRANLGPAGAAAAVEDVEAALLAAVRFAAYPEVAGALARLRADGARLVVVSNWDVSLHGVLRETGLAGLLDGALSSAEAGVAKPDPAIFAAALELVDADAEGAVMVGDSVATDVEGALGAGLAAVLVTRAAPGIPGAPAEPGVPPGVPTLPDLGGLPELVRYRR